jgi:hypothetical protein
MSIFRHSRFAPLGLGGGFAVPIDPQIAPVRTGYGVLTLALVWIITATYHSGYKDLRNPRSSLRPSRRYSPEPTNIGPVQPISSAVRTIGSDDSRVALMTSVVSARVLLCSSSRIDKLGHPHRINRARDRHWCDRGTLVAWRVRDRVPNNPGVAEHHLPVDCVRPVALVPFVSAAEPVPRWRPGRCRVLSRARTVARLLRAA